MNLPLKSTLIFTVECKTWFQLFLLCRYGAVTLCQCPGFLLTSLSGEVGAVSHVCCLCYLPFVSLKLIFVSGALSVSRD